MKYGDKIIIKKESSFKKTFFTTGTFIIDRPDLKIVLIELNFNNFMKHFEEVKYSDIEKTIFSFEIYENIFLKKYTQIFKNINWLNQLKNTISKKIAPEIFNKHVNNMIICKQQIDLWNKFLAAGKMIDTAKEVIKTNTKGYHRNSKVIHFIYKDYPNIELKDLVCIDDKINELRKTANTLLNEYNEIKKYINE